MRTASLLAAAAAAACAASASGEIVRVEDSDNTRCDDSRLSLVELPRLGTAFAGRPDSHQLRMLNTGGSVNIIQGSGNTIHVLRTNIRVLSVFKSL